MRYDYIAGNDQIFDPNGSSLKLALVSGQDGIVEVLGHLGQRAKFTARSSVVEAPAVLRAVRLPYSAVQWIPLDRL